MTTGKRVLTIAIPVVILSLVIALMAQTSPTKLEYLYTNLGQADVAAIKDELDKMGVINYIVDKNGIKVQPEQVIPLRLKLAQEGLPSHGQIGWEKFDQQDFTRTEFEQRIHKIRATQGELARTINNLDGVHSSRVHITAPKKSLFIEDQKEPTAAVYVKMKRSHRLSKKQINGIVHLVSRSIEGMRPEKVTIIDQEGKMLTEVESDDPTSKRTQEMLAYRRSLEKEFEERVRTIVSRVVGPERVEAKVDVTVDFTQEEKTINDIDPDKVVVLSSNTTDQSMDGNGLNPTGIPGAKSNVPGEQQELNATGSRAKSKRSTERLNYEIAKTKQTMLMAVGEIQRISAAVIVDGTQPYPIDGSRPVFEPRSEEEMKKIEAIVKSAIGFNDKRGDTVQVSNILFELAPYQIEAIKDRKEENRTYIATLAISAGIALALILFFAFIVRPYFRWLSYDPDRKAREANVEEFKPDLELGGIQNVQVKEDVPFEKMTPQEQILYLAKHEPARTTEALRMMLNPHHSAGA
jgi:flagellar M-ring protein FliF